jgi:hypothetical protein
MPFKHRNGGYTTSSPIYSYGVDNGYPEAPRGKHGSTDSIQHKLQPDFEAPRYMSDKTEPKHSVSGSGHPKKNGATAYPSKNATKIEHSLNRGVARGVPDRNSFSQKAGNVGTGYAKGTRLRTPTVRKGPSANMPDRLTRSRKSIL